MATQPIVDRDTILKMISLLDFCYRLGVTDAHAQDDEGLCREFIEKTSQPGVYGFLTDGYNVGVLEWQLRLTKQARLTSMFGSMYQYFNRMGRFSSNYLSCSLPVAQEFYNKGVTDYCTAPDGCDLVQFNDAKRVWWSHKGLLKISAREFVETIQLMCFDRQRKDNAYLEENAADYKARKIALKEKHYYYFIRAVGLALAQGKNNY